MSKQQMKTHTSPTCEMVLILPFVGEKEVEKLTRKKRSPLTTEYAAMKTKTSLWKCGNPGPSPSSAMT